MLSSLETDGSTEIDGQWPPIGEEIVPRTSRHIVEVGSFIKERHRIGYPDNISSVDYILYQKKHSW